jgi:hypothetical protein
MILRYSFFIWMMLPFLSSGQVTEIRFGTGVDLNTIKVPASTSQSYFFQSGTNPLNSPRNSFVNYGLNIGYDTNSFHQLVFGNGEDDFYFRKYSYGFSGWNKIWHSGNLILPLHQWQNYIGNNVDGSLDAMPVNSTVFSYPNGLGGMNTNAPVPGPVVHLSGFGDGSYGMQIQSHYGTGELYTRVNNDDIRKWTAWRKILSEDGNGNVGIGTTSTQGYKLAVNGDAIFTKVKVKSYSTWPDYVFTPTYKLPSLNEVEALIIQYKHLPDVPSAQEVEKNGLDLGENQAVLLKKIEELTLYVIQLQKEIEI